MKPHKSQIIRRKFGNNLKKQKPAGHGTASIRTNIPVPQMISNLIYSN